MTEKASDMDIRRGMESTPSLVLARELYILIGYYNKSKECLKFAKILLDPLQQFTFKMTGLELTVERPGKGQFSFQSQRKAMPKNAQTTTQLHSSHTLVK